MRAGPGAEQAIRKASSGPTWKRGEDDSQKLARPWLVNPSAAEPCASDPIITKNSRWPQCIPAGTDAIALQVMNSVVLDSVSKVFRHRRAMLHWMGRERC